MIEFNLFLIDHWFYSLPLFLFLVLWWRTESRRGGKRISTSELTTLVNKENAKILDVRPKDEFEKGTITSWSNDVKFIIKQKLINKKIIIIGSSLGAWLGLIQLKYFKNIIGFIGIGAAPEFLDRLIWKKLSRKNKNLVLKNKYYILKNDDYSYKITLKIIKDGRKNKVLNKKSNSKFPVYLLHGEKDNVVPQSLSRKILKVFPNSKKEFIKIKNGDHSLSRVKDLKILSNCMDKIIDYCAKPSL